MDFKKTITLLAVMCTFSSFGQELIAPYNIYRNYTGSSTADIFDTVPSDEIWKVEGFGTGSTTKNAYVKLNGVWVYFSRDYFITTKFPFWLDSGEIIQIPGTYNNPLTMISILRFKKPD